MKYIYPYATRNVSKKFQTKIIYEKCENNKNELFGYKPFINCKDSSIEYLNIKKENRKKAISEIKPIEFKRKEFLQDQDYQKLG